jgi:hypothetical protein
LFDFPSDFEFLLLQIVESNHIKGSLSVDLAVNSWFKLSTQVWEIGSYKRIWDQNKKFHLPFLKSFFDFSSLCLCFSVCRFAQDFIIWTGERISLLSFLTLYLYLMLFYIPCLILTQISLEVWVKHIPSGNPNFNFPYKGISLLSFLTLYLYLMLFYIPCLFLTHISLEVWVKHIPSGNPNYNFPYKV